MKAMKKKGLVPRAINSGSTTDGSQYNKLYGLACFGRPTYHNPAPYVQQSRVSLTLPVATAAGPLRWQPPVALAPSQPSASQPQWQLLR